jgi:hypothetical protein
MARLTASAIRRDFRSASNATRASEIAKEIMASGEVAKSRATLNDRPGGQGHRGDV